MPRNKELKSITYHLDRNSVDVAWKSQIIEDGQVIYEENHNGAFPVDANGDLSPADEAKLGAKLTTLLTQAGAKAVKQIDKVRDEVVKLEADLDAERETKAEIRAERDQLIQALADQNEVLTRTNSELLAASSEIVRLTGDLTAAVQLVDGLRQAIASLQTELDAARARITELENETELRDDLIDFGPGSAEPVDALLPDKVNEPSVLLRTEEIPALIDDSAIEKPKKP